jgi:hypothetical protein
MKTPDKGRARFGRELDTFALEVIFLVLEFVFVIFG